MSRAAQGSMWSSTPAEMIDVADLAVAAARDMEHAADHFAASSKIPGHAPVITRANRRAARSARQLNDAAHALREQAEQHRQLALEEMRRKGTKRA